MQLILWFTKVKRAQNVDDFETWQDGGGNADLKCDG